MSEIKRPGSIVWCKLKGHSWWPAMVIDRSSYATATLTSVDKSKTANSIFVFWYGEQSVSHISRKTRMAGFGEKYKHLKPINSRNCKLQNAVGEAMSDLRVFNESVDETRWQQILHSWRSHFRGKMLAIREQNPNGGLSNFVQLELKKLQKRNTTAQQPTVNELEAAVRTGATCISCKTTGGAHVLQGHPLFQVKLCNTCLEKYVDNFFLLGANNYSTHCAVCTNHHGEAKPAACPKSFCYRTYCHHCCKIITQTNAEKFICVLCESRDDCLWRSWPTWRENICGLQFLKKEYRFPETKGKQVNVLISNSGWKTVQVATKFLNWTIGLFHKESEFKVDELLLPVTGAILVWDDGDENMLVNNFMEAFFHLQDIREKNSSFGQHTKDIYWLFGLPSNISHAFQCLLFRYLECYPQTWSTDDLPRGHQLVWTNILGLHDILTYAS